MCWVKPSRTFENRANVSFYGGFEEYFHCHLKFYATGKELSRKSLYIMKARLKTFHKIYAYVG